MKILMHTSAATAIALGLMIACSPTGDELRAGTTNAQVPENVMKSLAMPDRIETRIGTLEFFDGFPTEETVERALDRWGEARLAEVERGNIRGHTGPAR